MVSMKIHKNNLGDFGYVYIENMYTETQLQSIKNEIENITWMMDNVPSIQKARNLHSARTEDNKFKMTGNGLLIDSVYTKREYSPMLKHNRKIFKGKIKEAIESTHPANVAYDLVTKDFTMLNKFTYKNEYLSHKDLAAFTGVTFLTLDDKEMTGGDFVFTDYDKTFKFKDNCSILFPSWVNHHCTKLETKNVTRYSMAQFIVVSYV